MGINTLHISLRTVASHKSALVVLLRRQVKKKADTKAARKVIAAIDNNSVCNPCPPSPANCGNKQSPNFQQSTRCAVTNAAIRAQTPAATPLQPLSDMNRDERSIMLRMSCKV